MTCSDCKFFHYESAREYGLWSEDFYCTRNHEVVRHIDTFIPLYKCNDFQDAVWPRRITGAEMREVLGDIEYHRQVDEGEAK